MILLGLTDIPTFFFMLYAVEEFGLGYIKA
jgi:hypothetical protein